MIYQNFTNFLKNRTIELLGLSLVFFAVLLSVSFFSYTPNDPTFLYGSETNNIKNLLGLYGGIVADFLLQSFGLTSFLVLITILSWGLNLIIKKKIKKIKYKFFYLFLYIIFSCLFIYSSYNNSFWLIDNGNSGFVGQIIFDEIIIILPFVKHEYSTFFFLVLSIVFFVFASGINFKYLLIKPIFISNYFKRNNDLEMNYDLNNTLDSHDSALEKTQQTFSFDKTPKVKESLLKNETFKNFKLPSLDLLEKNPSKINLLDLSKNRPDGSFIEKILLDFGIDGKITKINNGPVVSLYEFEPAPGVKVSKIINLSDDLARNTSSTSARVSTIPGKNTVGIEIPNESR